MYPVPTHFSFAGSRTIVANFKYVYLVFDFCFLFFFDPTSQLASERKYLQLSVRLVESDEHGNEETAGEHIEEETEDCQAGRASAADLIEHLNMEHTGEEFGDCQAGYASAAELIEDLNIEDHERQDEHVGAGSAAPQHKQTMVPGAPSGANVIAIEMPDCAMAAEQAERKSGEIPLEQYVYFLLKLWCFFNQVH